MTGREFVSLRRGIAVCILLAAVGAGAQTEDATSGPAVAAPDGDAASPSREQQNVIVLRDGRVLQGTVGDRPGGYLVQVANGSIIVPFEQVRLTASSLTDAYQKLREGLKQPNAADHVALARWCVGQQLYGSAREELADALRLEPQRADARALLVEITKRLEDDPVVRPVAVESPSSEDGFQSRPAESLGGLSPGVTQDFVRKVQPLLMNRCANANCHGAAGRSEFRLQPVRIGGSGHRVFTERNLSAVLTQVNLQDPEQSPLLVEPQGVHGGQTSAVFSGPRSADQTRLLEEWVLSVAREQSKLPAGDRSPKSNAQESDAGRSDQRLLDQVLREEQPDRFDPRVFNRLMHSHAD